MKILFRVNRTNNNSYNKNQCENNNSSSQLMLKLSGKTKLKKLFKNIIIKHSFITDVYIYILLNPIYGIIMQNII